MKRAIATAPGEPTQYVDLTVEEIAERQAEAELPMPVAPLSQRLETMLLTAVQQPGAAALLTLEQIDALSSLKAKLREAALIWPESVFAQLAHANISAFVEPEAFATLKADMLTACQEVIDG
jgi:hypothetical protein